MIHKTLNDEQVMKIRLLNAKEGLSCRTLAGRYGVSHMTIHRAITGRNWRELKKMGCQTRIFTLDVL